MVLGQRDPQRCSEFSSYRTWQKLFRAHLSMPSFWTMQKLSIRSLIGRAGFLLGPGHQVLCSAILIFVPAISRTSCTKTPGEIMVNQ